MSSWTRLFQRPKRRHFALLDEERRCRMLLTTVERPCSAQWIEVPEIRLDWIGKPIPGALQS
ncbi:hypothetical protein ACYCFL_07970 [Stutzerimonas nitrititolerans]|uniref:hypothetical protein n=1 Tax=Stutzerimonas nitrititolerans TaxID=2482751 RepID=UPI000718650C|nr:hypothetical protein [Stutzerimonas nitrititolerans]KRW73524.1 hypothetical protein AO735_13405 [Pseudomonas sp. TTU2014-096BSC]MBA1236646.1 hypothetical protein [Stutzerimonas stutzeri]MBT1121791.1 hypothetical protein [Stutzerimonas nitrititolerans]WAD26182.1 hypothetical protein OS670_17490 [Pseudomonadaceae bacterium T75]